MPIYSSPYTYLRSISGSKLGAYWETLADYDLTDLVTTGSLSLGNNTLSFASIPDTIDVNHSVYSGGADIAITPTNGSGLVYDGGTDFTSTGLCTFRVSDWLPSYGPDEVQKSQYAISFSFTADFSASYGNSGFYCGLNNGNNTTHNSGDSRHIHVMSDIGGVDEKVFVRTNTTSTSSLATQTIRTSRTITSILSFGEVVQVMDSAGLSPPVPDPRQVYGTYIVGGDAVGRNSLTRTYQGNLGLRGFLACTDGADLVLSRILVRRLV